MFYAFDETEQAFQTELWRFCTDVLAPHYQPDDRAAVMRPTLLSDMASVGLTGLRIPAEFGGQEASAVVAGLAAEEVGRADFNATYVIINTCLVADIIVRHANRDRQAEWLPPIAAGEVIPALLLTEPDHGSDAASMECRAERDGDDWIITGEKTSITFGTVAPTGLLMARTGGPGARGVSAFYVPLDQAKVSRSGFDDLGGRSIGRASIHFDGLRVPGSAMVGNEGDGFVSVMEGFDYSRAIIGLGCLGAAQQSLDETLQWTKDREAFGQPIGKFQAVSFPLAEAATHIRGARHVCYEALWLKDQGRPHGDVAAMAKLWAPRLSVEVIHQCLLTFGHTGYSTDSPLGQRLRDVIGLEIGDGTAQISSLVIARHLLGRAYAP